MKTMSDPVELGLPELTEKQIEQLTEECQDEVTRYVLSILPPKSLSELSVVCTIDFDTQLSFRVEIDLSQEYDTGHSVDDITDQAARHGAEWLEKRLRELKAR